MPFVPKRTQRKPNEVEVMVTRISSKRLFWGAAFGGAVSLLAALPWGLLVGLSSDDIGASGNGSMVFRALAIPAFLKGGTAEVFITLGWCCWGNKQVGNKKKD